MMKRYFAAFLATVLILNTSVESLGIVSHAEGQQPTISSIIQETDETEEGLQEIQHEVLSSTATEENIETEALELSAVTNEESGEIVSEEISMTDRKENSETEQHTEGEVLSESAGEQRTDQEVEKETQTSTDKSRESIESASEIEGTSETECDRETEGTSEIESDNETQHDRETESISVVESISETESIDECETELEIIAPASEAREIELNYDKINLIIGETKQLKAVFKSGDAVTDGVCWMSSDNTVATVNDGEVTAVGAGEATVTIVIEAEQIRADCIVKVSENIAVNNIDLNYSELTMSVGDNEQLVVSIDGTEMDYRDIIWESSDEDIVYVEKGYVYAISSGNAIVTATHDRTQKKIYCEIEVKGSSRRKAPASYTARSGYDAAAALRYAEAHWNDGVGLCAQFVSECIKAGGVNIYNLSCTALRGQLISSNLITEHTVSLSGGYLSKSALSGELEPGDIVMYYCSAETDGKPYVHAVLCNGFDSNGRMKAYAHNSAKNGKTAMIYSKCGYCGNAIKTAHVFHFNGNTNNKSPIGSLDEIKVSDSSVTIRGWARDDNDANRAVNIVMEIGGNTYTTTANQYRSDVGTHGFSASFNVNCYGTQTVNVYAVDADINQQFLLQNGSRTVTIQRANKIDYEVSQVDLAYGASKRIPFTFQGDGIASLDIATGNGDIAKARLENIDWNNGTGYINISSDIAVGKTDLTIAFKDSNGNKFFRKSIPVVVTGDFDIQFDTKIHYVRAEEECRIDFTVKGEGAAQIYFDSSDADMVNVQWYQQGYDVETRKGSLAVKGLKQGSAFVYVNLYDLDQEIIYQKSCTVIVKEEADIIFRDKKMKVGKGSSKSQMVAYSGYGVTDLTVECINPEIAEASIKSHDKSKKEVEVVFTGHKVGKATFLFYLWDATGNYACYRSLTITVEEPFEFQVDDDTVYMWNGQLKRIYYLINTNYQERYTVSYQVEDGEDVVQITGYEGDENDGRSVFLEALSPGTATLKIRITGLVDGKDTILCEHSIFIMVFALKPSSEHKTMTVGETFQMGVYCDPATPTDLKLSYASSDDAIANVSSGGLVTAKKQGTVSITVTGTLANKKEQSVSCELTVVGKTIHVTGISLSPTRQELTVGDTGIIKAAVQPANATDNQISYQSSNPSIVSVDQFGRVKAIDIGNARITAVSRDGNKKAYCDIVVYPAVVASGRTGDLDWKITEAQGAYTLTICGQGAMADYDEPDTENEPEWYPYHRDLTHLVLEKGITKIGDNAFAGCTGLSGTLVLPDDLTSIGANAFYGCSRLSGDLTLPKNLNKIGCSAFQECAGFTGDLMIPDTVSEIGESAFYNCSGLDGALRLSGNIKAIEANTFKNTRFGNRVIIPAAVTRIGDNAFYNIPLLKVLFEGDAPKSIRPKNSNLASFSADVQIYYDPDKFGWSTPEWNAYAAEPVSKDTPFEIPVEGIDMTVTGEYLCKGDSITLQYWLIPENTTERDVIWESSNISVVTVDENGRVEAVGYGEAVITVTTKNGKYAQTCNILVAEQPDPTLYVNFDEASSWLWVGETRKMNFHFGGRGFVAVGPTVYDAAVAACVDSDISELTPSEGEGVHQQRHGQGSMDIRGKRQGKTKIAVRLYDGRTNMLYQNFIDLTVVDLKLSDYYLELQQGKRSKPLTAAMYPEIGETIAVQYQSSDETIVTVDQNGVLSALKPGSAVITVTSTDGAISKDCDVLVYKEGTIEKPEEKPSDEESSTEESSAEKPTDEETSTEESSDEKPSDEESSNEETSEEKPDDEPSKDKDDSSYPAAERQDLSALNASIAGIRPQTYNRDEQEPAVKVTAFVNGKKTTLIEGMDYRVSYKNNIDAGTATITIKGNGAYKGTLTQNFTIRPKAVKKLKVVAGALSENATGSDLSSYPIHVYDGAKRLNLGTDYTLSSTGMTKNAAKVSITGKGNYTGTMTAKLSVYSVSSDHIINPDHVRLDKDTAAYTGKPVKTVNPIVTVSGSTLTLNQDYKVQYQNNTNAGTAYVIVTGKGAYRGRVVLPFEIQPVSASVGAVTIKPISAKTYNGKLQKPAVSVTSSAGGKTKKLVKNKDYKVTYKNNLHAGTATVIITGKGNYAGMKVQTQFTIQPQSIAKAAVKGTQSSLQLTYNKRLLKQGVHYEAPSYGGSTKNKVQVTIKGKGDFTGQITKYIKQ